MVWKAFVSLLVFSVVALASTTYPVTDTNQRYCYDSYRTGIGYGDVGLTSENQAQDHRVQEAEAFVLETTSSTRNLDAISCPSSGQDAAYPTLKEMFQQNDDGTITDLNTRLMWTEKVFGDGLPYSEVESEVSYITTGGYSDWRIPTVKELYTLSEFNGETGNSEETNVPYINTRYFTVKYSIKNYPHGQLWSSNQYTGAIFSKSNSECNFGFNPIDGTIKCHDRASTTMSVRYVRGNTNIGINNFSESAESAEIIVDAATGLEWTRSDSGIALDWDEALDYCNDLELGGYSDWKLPDAHELQSIVDYSRSPDGTGTPAIDALFDSKQIENEAGDVDWGWYWTSTTHLDGVPLGFKAVYICFGRAMGHVEAPDGTIIGAIDMHGAGAQRSDPKVLVGSVPSTNNYGPQGDYRRVYNYARCVRRSSSPPPDA